MAKVIDTGILSGIIYARDYASAWHKWVVIVTPYGVVASIAQKYFSAVSDGLPFSGRTFLVGGQGGKVSLTPSNCPVFVPDTEDFSVLFLGWGQGGNQNSGGMATWRSAATEELRLEI